jgi:hypothetical protein
MVDVENRTCTSMDQSLKESATKVIETRTISFIAEDLQSSVSAAQVTPKMTADV